jgi:hypothetical protein
MTDRDPLCDEALRTNRVLRARIAELERGDVARLNRDRDEAWAEADAARLYVWQRLPWKGYAS